MVEALACGTPVVALRRGSTPEVVEHGITGFLAEDEDGLVRAIRRLPELDRATCRTVAERRLSPPAMAERDERVSRPFVTPQPPHAPPDRAAGARGDPRAARPGRRMGGAFRA